MSTVKIKTEPATTATTAVDVHIKLEPSLSTADIKLEQHTSDIDAKVESDSDTDSEEDEIKSEDDDDTDQDQEPATSSNQKQFICKHPGCTYSFKKSSHLRMHRYEHKLQADLYINGKTYFLARQSLDDRWSCPIPDCKMTSITAYAVSHHIRRHHGKYTRQQQLSSQIAKRKCYFVDVDDFNVNGVHCGYHNTIGVFICHECRLVPECLLTHLQQKHGFNKKSIDSSALPESAVNASADPSINQHTSNSHLAAAIRQPYQQQHQDIVQGWLCVAPNCGYCSYAAHNKLHHKKDTHQGWQISTVPALVLRLLYAKTHASSFLITRIDQASGAVATSSNKVNQHRLDYSHNGLNTQDENGDDTGQDEITDAPNQKRQWKCEYPNCGRLFNSLGQISTHRREHTLEVVVNARGNTYTVTRKSSGDRWPCPIPGCEKTCKTVDTIRRHIRSIHSASMRLKRANSEDDDDNQQQQQQSTKKRHYFFQYLNVDDFYVNGTKYCYHTTTGLFICYDCRLVPECLLTHLKQSHGFDEKSVDSEFLPGNARITGSDPNGNQHTSNSHLAAAICEPGQLQHPDIIQGWLCVASGCDYCHFTKESRYKHQFEEHKGKQLSTVPALVLRLFYRKTLSSSFFITRLDTITSNSNRSNDSTDQHNIEHNDGDDDGEELVLSNYSD